MNMNYFANQGKKKNKKKACDASRTSKRVDNILIFFSIKLQIQSGILILRSMVNYFYSVSGYQTRKVSVKILYCVLCPNVHLIINYKYVTWLTLD